MAEPSAPDSDGKGLKASRERFIPFRRRDVVDMCAGDVWFTDGQRARFRQVAALVSALIHHEFHGRLERLKEAYAPVNPDLDTRALYGRELKETEASQDVLLTELRHVIEKANFEQLDQDDLDAALDAESLFEVHLRVNFDDFEEILFFRRGESVRTETVRKWFGLRKAEITFRNFDRVVVFFRFREAKHFSKKRLRNAAFVPGSVVVKLFQDVPKDDIEMLFPNAEVRMKLVDKLFIGVPALVSGLVVLFTKLGTSLILIGSLIGFWLGLRAKGVQLDQTTLIALGAGMGALGGYLWKQFSNFRHRKVRFMKALADMLYFKNLDNNAGVFHRLIDTAEEEETKEVLLAYYMLLRTAVPMTAEELDLEIEFWFSDRWNCDLDFDVTDALDKLRDLKLVREAGGKITPVALPDAHAVLDARWDDIFDAERDGTREVDGVVPQAA